MQKNRIGECALFPQKDRAGGRFAARHALAEGIFRQPTACANCKGRLEKLVERLKNSTVTVHTKKDVGSGVILLSGLSETVVLTNRHVIATSKQKCAKGVEVHFGKAIFRPDGILIAPHRIDLALIKIGTGIGRPVKIARKKPKAGAGVVVIGASMGIDDTVSTGIVSNIMEEKAKGKFKYDVIKTDAMINPGNSGGGVFSLRGGKLVGITAYKLKIGKGQLAEGGYAIGIWALEEMPFDEWKEIVVR
jgi:S1-C subfamily serine protease